MKWHQSQSLRHQFQVDLALILTNFFLNWYSSNRRQSYWLLILGKLSGFKNATSIISSTYCWSFFLFFFYFFIFYFLKISQNLLLLKINGHSVNKFLNLLFTLYQNLITFFFCFFLVHNSIVSKMWDVGLNHGSPNKGK